MIDEKELGQEKRASMRRLHAANWTARRNGAHVFPCSDMATGCTHIHSTSAFNVKSYLWTYMTLLRRIFFSRNNYLHLASLALTISASDQPACVRRSCYPSPVQLSYRRHARWRAHAMLQHRWAQQPLMRPWRAREPSLRTQGLARLQHSVVRGAWPFETSAQPWLALHG